MQQRIINYARLIRQVLDEKVVLSVSDLQLYMDIQERELYAAVGWLVCEEKIHLLADENDRWTIVLIN